MGFLHFYGHGEIDEREVADLDIILEVECARGWHVSIGVILGEIAHSEAGMQGGSLMEDGLRVPDFQLT